MTLEYDVNDADRLGLEGIEHELAGDSIKIGQRRMHGSIQRSSQSDNNAHDETRTLADECKGRININPIHSQKDK